MDTMGHSIQNARKKKVSKIFALDKVRIRCILRNLGSHLIRYRSTQMLNVKED